MVPVESRAQVCWVLPGLRDSLNRPRVGGKREQGRDLPRSPTGSVAELRLEPPIRVLHPLDSAASSTMRDALVQGIVG